MILPAGGACVVALVGEDCADTFPQNKLQTIDRARASTASLRNMAVTEIQFPLRTAGALEIGVFMVVFLPVLLRQNMSCRHQMKKEDNPSPDIESKAISLPCFVISWRNYVPSLKRQIQFISTSWKPFIVSRQSTLEEWV